MLDLLERNRAAVRLCLQQIADLARCDFDRDDIAGSAFERDRAARILDHDVALRRISVDPAGNVSKCYDAFEDLYLHLLDRIDRRPGRPARKIEICSERRIDLDAFARKAFRRRARPPLDNVADPKPIDLSGLCGLLERL